MPPVPVREKAARVLRRSLQHGVIAAALSCVVTTGAVKLAALLVAIAAIALIGLGSVIRSAATLGVGAIAFFLLLILFQGPTTRACEIVWSAIARAFEATLYVAALTYTLLGLALVAGGVWIDRFSLSAVGGVALLPVVAVLAHQRKARQQQRGPFENLPPEGHLHPNRLKSQEEAEADAQELSR